MSLWNLWGNRRRRERELDEELASHLAMAIRERVERGEDPREAELAAMREFGNTALVRETTRAIWISAWLEQLLQDLRYASRNMLRKRAITFIVVASLALGIGANMALFSIAYPVLLRPLPVSHPEQLVELLQKYPDEPRGNGYWTSRSYEFYKDHNHVFSSLTATSINYVTRIETSPSDPAVVVGESVAPNYFSSLGIHTAVGRLIGSDDADSPVAVLSWSLWRSRFREDPAVLGKRVLVNGASAVVIGVAARAYTGLLPNAQTDVWIPVKRDQGLNLIGRLKPGINVEQARNEMKVLYRFTIEERASGSKDPQVRELQIELESARSGMAALRDRVGQTLTILLALVAVLLLLACVNIAGIMLAQAAGRDREMALRSGLGASRGRLIRQVLTESCLLSFGGTVLGLVVAYLGTATLLKILDSGRLHERVHLLVEVDGTMVLFTAGVALLTGILTGLAPAIHILRDENSTGLRQSGRVVRSRAQRSFGRALVSSQVALAILLLSLGALFSTNLARLREKDLGFRRDHVLLASVEAGRSGYSGGRLAAAIHDVLREAKNIPGVLTASVGAPTPLMGAGASGWVAAEGFQDQPEQRRRISISWVSPRYFEALRIPVLAGRDFDSRDETTPRQVAIISEGTARYYFRGQSPLGKRITLDQVTMMRDPATYEIVGVVGNTNYREIREADQRLIYLPAFGPGRATARTFVIRTAVEPEGIANDLRRIVQRNAPDLSLSRVGTLNAQVDASIVPERMMATLSGFFAAVGGLLAGIGLYGLLAYNVMQRTTEIGVRLALGATSGRILRMVLGEATAITLIGALAGVPLALWSRAITGHLLPEISGTPASAVIAGLLVLLAIAAVAAITPARRATEVDAMQCLRHE